MSAAKHTPGPWEVCGPDIYPTSGNLRGFFIAKRGDGLLAECFANCLVETDEQCRANADLIAAAPELLGALALCERSISHIMNMCNEKAPAKIQSRAMELVVECLDASRAAISKATGSAS